MAYKIEERLEKTFNLLLHYFEGNKQKVMFWFQADNPALGGISPLDMILIGRYKKLEEFVRSALEENYR